MNEINELRTILEALLKMYSLKDIVATLAALCYDRAAVVRETRGPDKARDWVKAANYLMGTSANVNITNTDENKNN